MVQPSKTKLVKHIMYVVLLWFKQSARWHAESAKYHIPFGSDTKETLSVYARFTDTFCLTVGVVFGSTFVAFGNNDERSRSVYLHS